jgi:hypothetical protein
MIFTIYIVQLSFLAQYLPKADVSSSELDGAEADFIMGGETE